MNNLIFDASDNEYSREAIILGKNSEKIISIKVVCKANYFLKIDEQLDGATISGRISGIGSYVDLAEFPIDLSEFDGETKTFQIKIKSENPVANFTKLPIELKVSFNGN
jgi:hypothetical protein